MIKNNPREKEYKFCPRCRAKLSRQKIDRRKLLACSKCGFIFWNNPKPVVSGILENNKKILLTKRAQKPLKNYWCLPGGYIDYEEKTKLALVREFKEETDLKIRIKKLIGVYQIDNDPRGINLDIIYSVAAISKNKIKLNEEASDFRFFPLNKLPKLIAYKHQRAIEDYKRYR